MDLNFVVMIEIKATSFNLSLFLVEVTGFEPATSCSQSRRATNCATPRSFFINLYFSLTCLPLLCSPSCGARFFLRDFSLGFSDRCAKPCFASSATGGACRPCPNQARYQLRYTSFFLYKLVFFSNLSVLALLALLRCPPKRRFSAAKAGGKSRRFRLHTLL